MALLVVAERLLGQILADGACKRIGDDERRRGEIIRFHIRRDAAFEIAVAGNDRRADEIVLVDRFGNLIRQRPRIADAGGAAEADEVEAELVERFLQAGFGEIFRDDLRARRQRGLHPRLLPEAFFDGVAGEQPRADQHARIRGVGAGGDGGDDDVAMSEIEIRALDLDAAGHVLGLSVFVRHCGGEALRDGVERDAPFRPFGAGERGHDIAEIELQRIGEDRVGRRALAQHALRLGVGLDQRDARRGAACVLQIVDGFGVDGEEAAGRAIFRSHIGDGGAVRQGQGLEAGAEELDEFADDALLAQHLRHGEHDVRRRHAFAHLAGQFEADDFRQQHGLRLAEHGGFGLDAADAPAENGEAVDHGRVRVGADQRVGIGEVHRHGLAARRLVFLLPRPDRLGEIFGVDLMADAGAGRHDAEIREGALAPFQEAVALLIAFVFEIDVFPERLGVAEFVDDDRMVDDEIDGNQRIDLFGIAAERGHRVTHRGEIDDGGNAGEILHQHARRAEGDFVFVPAAIDEPSGDSSDVVFPDRAAIFETQQIFKQNLHREG